MRLEDARRLTGRNLLGPGPLVVAELALEPPERVDDVVAAWRTQLARMRGALGLSPDVTPVLRAGRTWVVAGFGAPIDELMAGAEATEWAAWSATEVLAGRPPLPLEPKRAEIAAILERDRDPRLLALQAEATRRGLAFLWDDEEVSVGHGCRSMTWGLRALPEVADVPWARLGRVPVALVTGTNGKTTSTRLLARMVAQTGVVVGSSCSDGVAIGAQSLRTGDWTGPAAARLVLRDPTVEFAVLETARGGILRRGLACDDVDAALITHVTDDHLGTFGIDDLDGMAEVKAVVARAVRPGGRVVLNARDARLVALAARLTTPVSFFADLERDPSAAAVIDAHAARGGHAVVARGGEVLELQGGAESRLTSVAAVPLTFGGAARYNVENALGAAAMARGLGLDTAAIVRALEGFGSADNPGRGETHLVGGVTVFIDYAHNPDGVASALSVARALLRHPHSRLAVITGSPGDRTDAEIEAVVRNLRQARVDRVFLREIEGYLRGRAPGEVPALFQKLLRAQAFAPEAIVQVSTEVEALERAMAQAQPGDVVALLVHVERQAVRAWLEARRGG